MLERHELVDGLTAGQAACLTMVGRANGSRGHSVRALGVDQIAMATHARSTAGRVFMGSVALSVLQSAHVPLLLLHPREA